MICTRIGATAYNAAQAYKRLRAHVKARGIALWWQEATAKRAEEHRIKRARLGDVDDPLESLA